jgi:hypothetical protein
MQLPSEVRPETVLLSRPVLELPPIIAPLLLIAFGLVAVGLIRAFDDPTLRRSDLLLMACSLSALLTSLIWFFVLALGRGALWSIAMLIPYVNLLAASSFARRYWNEGARAPALLAIAGMIGETIAALRLLIPATPPLL